MGKKEIVKEVVDVVKEVAKTFAEKKGIAIDDTGIKLNRPEPVDENTINRGHPSLKV